MKFHGIDSQGFLYDERVTSLPVWTPDDEGRIVYNIADESIYYATSTEWKAIWSDLNIFKNIVVGTETVSASGAADTFTLIGGTGIYLSVNTVTKEITISLAGTNSDGTYLYTQAYAGTSWYVTHNLGSKIAAVSVINESYELIIPNNIEFIDNNNLLITFSEDQAGYARVVCGKIVNGVERSGFTYYQGTASASWTIPHNLNQKYVVYSIVDNAGNLLIPNYIDFTSSNSMSVSFGDAQIGSARVVSAIDKNPIEIGSYTHTQGSASTTWNVAHNLNSRFAVLSVLDASDRILIPDGVTFTDNNNLVITFADAQSGTARIVS